MMPFSSSPIQVLGFACGLAIALVLVDLLTGIAASVRRNEAIVSSKLRHSVSKTIIYCAFLIVSLLIGCTLHLIDGLIVPGGSELNLLRFTLLCIQFQLYFICWIEGVSNLENLRVIFPRSLFLRYCHYLLSVEFVKWIPKLSNFLKEQQDVR